MDAALKRILYVEDDPDIQMIAQIALEDLGKFTVKLCSSGEEAIAQAEEFKPDLFLLDVMMPGLDGIETLKELRKIHAIQHVPAILLTARTQQDELDKYKRLGLIDVIDKPFDVMTLAETIRQYWFNYHG